MGAATDHITAEQYFSSSRAGDRTQLIDGVMVVNEPRFLHGVVQLRIASALNAWTEQAPGRGRASMPIDVVMSEHDVYGPDVVWFRAERLPSDWEAEQQEIPDLAVEIRSPGTWRFDVGRKRDTYERGGLPELWLVDTQAEVVTAHRRSAAGVAVFDIELVVGSGERLTSPLLPGFALDLSPLFARR
ncbi:MAG: Uma2 family endonuclease [Thermoleophilaceae bacterium]